MRFISPSLRLMYTRRADLAEPGVVNDFHTGGRYEKPVRTPSQGLEKCPAGSGAKEGGWMFAETVRELFEHKKA
jgi:hypothetical protein